MKRKRASESVKKETISKKTKTKNDGDDEVLHYTKAGQLDMRYSSSKRLMMRLSQSINQSNTDDKSNRSVQRQSASQGTSESKQTLRSTSSLQKVKTEVSFSNIVPASIQETLPIPNLKREVEGQRHSLASSAGAWQSRLPCTGISSSEVQEMPLFNFEDQVPEPSASTLSVWSASTSPSAGFSVHNETTLPIECSSTTCSLPSSMISATVVQVVIPSSVPVTKSNLPDMRTKAGREWVERQAQDSTKISKQNGGVPTIPSWIPRHKDGTIDTNKSAAQHYLNLKSQHAVNIPVYDSSLRSNYYQKKLKDKESNFYHYVKMSRAQPVDDVTFLTMANSEILKAYLNKSTFESCTAASTQFHSGTLTSSSSSSSTSSSSSSSNHSFTIDDYKIPTYIPKLDYETLDATIGDKAANKIGNGAFGIVYKGYWNGMEVAIKKLFLDPLTTGDKSSFMIELKILAAFGDHPNLVKLYGYTIEPCSLIMEFVKLGSLSHLLYYCEDDYIEAKLCDGRIKKRIACGIVNGMKQLHSVSIIHGDLKPANILVDKDFTAKITDFGLARLRGKTSSLVASNIREDGENVVAGTAAYMAPELLDSMGPQELLTDVYSFGILVNELIHEEEPYSQDYDKIRGRGPFGAANLAKLGHRPYLNNAMVPWNLADLIRRCWNSLCWNRPTFDAISKEIGVPEMIFPNFI